MVEMTCIMCPIGCHITYENQVIKGNRCKRGFTYAKEEIECPKRMVTSTVKTLNPLHPRMSVKTSKPLVKSYVFKLMEVLNEITIDQDIHIGDVIISHVLNTDVDIISTQEVKKT